jgi:hypothetical protein
MAQPVPPTSSSQIQAFDSADSVAPTKGFFDTISDIFSSPPTGNSYYEKAQYDKAFPLLKRTWEECTRTTPLDTKISLAFQIAFCASHLKEDAAVCTFLQNGLDLHKDKKCPMLGNQSRYKSLADSVTREMRSNYQKEEYGLAIANAQLLRNGLPSVIEDKHITYHTSSIRKSDRVYTAVENIDYQICLIVNQISGWYIEGSCHFKLKRYLLALASYLNAWELKTTLQHAYERGGKTRQIYLTQDANLPLAICDCYEQLERHDAALPFYEQALQALLSSDPKGQIPFVEKQLATYGKTKSA